ncbi:MAG: DNA polymerase IV [Anaerolineaceae bacterium]|nr:DNA polymerase IV [Anaerolineaceae bacterium]
MSARKILHIDLDAFFCSVEELHNPDLHGKPFAVGGDPNGRSVVSSCSYAARQYGVRSAMPCAKALRLCPDLIFVHSGYGQYTEASHAVMEIIRDLTPMVQQISIDEAFLDVSDLPDSALSIARRLQSDIYSKTKLPTSLGVAGNKLMAKIANNIGKSNHKKPTPPMAITVVEPGEESAFLENLPVRELWGVGPKMAERLNMMGFKTIGQIAGKPVAFWEKAFGKSGRDIWERAQGQDERMVVEDHSVKSISQEVTFNIDIADPEILRKKILNLSEQVGYRLRKKGLCGTTIRLKIRWANFETHTRQKKMHSPVDQDRVIFEQAYEQMMAFYPFKQPVRLIGVGVSGLTNAMHQLPLWETEDEKERRLLNAVDEVRNRFGKNVLKRGNSIKKK